MNCPKCEGKRLAIYDSRHTQYDVIRKRRCLACEFRFYTVERYMSEDEFDDARDEKYSNITPEPQNGVDDDT